MAFNEQFPRGLITPIDKLSRGYPITKLFENYLGQLNVPFYDLCCPAASVLSPVRAVDDDSLEYFDRDTETWLPMDIASASSVVTIYSGDSNLAGDRVVNLDSNSLFLGDIGTGVGVGISPTLVSVVGDLALETYGDGSHNGTPTYGLFVDASGNVLEGISSSSDISVQWSVLQILNTPGSPAAGDSFLVGTAPTGAFSAHPNEIAFFDDPGYTFSSPSVGDLLYNADTSYVYKWTGSSWIQVGRLLIHQGGDTYGGPISIGTKDDYKLSFLQNNIERAYIDNIPGYHYITTPTGVRFTGTGFGSGVVFFDAYTSIFNDGANNVVHSSYGGRWIFRDANLDGKIYIRENRTSMKYPTLIGGASILTSPVNDAILELTSTQKGLLLPRMTKAQRNLISPAISTGTIVGGSGYTNGVYSNIAMTGGSGISTRADITVAGGVVTVVTPDPANTDGQYVVGDVLTSAIPGGSGFTYTITAMVAPAAGMAVYQTDNTPGLRVYNGTNWMRFTETID